MTLDERTAPVVLRIFREYLLGKGLQGIADILNFEGIQSPGAYHSGSGKLGPFWTKSAVRSILINSRYATGISSGNEQPDLTSCQAIVDLEDFDRVQKMFADRRIRHTANTAPEARSYLLRGLLRCGRCNRLMQGAWNNDEPYYRCRSSGEYTTVGRNSHPRNVYLRERRVKSLLIPWLQSVCERRRLMQMTTTVTNLADREAVIAASCHSLSLLHDGDPQEQADALKAFGLRLLYADAAGLLHVKAVLEPAKLVIRETLTL
ncbi:recombinase family protein [Streptomyces sp. NPDC019890]|uniref:recombinase family protein n=1 Tax=Streptomyces sp. NPDC019890 TaxID=3365064 RepID=UPI00384CB56E